MYAFYSNDTGFEKDPMRWRGCPRDRPSTLGSRPPGRRLRQVLAIGVAAALSCVALSGCGLSSSTAGSTTGCKERPVSLSSTGVVEAGKCPTDTAISIDRTAFGEGPQVGAQVASEVIAAGRATLANGGLMSVVLYGRDADREVTIYQGSLATAAQEDQFSRSEQDQQVEAAIHSAAANAFAQPSQQTPEMRRATALLQGEGSDIARSLREAIRSVSRDDGNATAVINLTDGLNATPELPLPKLIGQESASEIAHRLAIVAGMGHGAKVGLIAIPTVGQVPPQYQRQQLPELTDRLVSAWQKACGLLHPGKCVISTSV